jgi:hypothetical protein
MMIPLKWHFSDSMSPASYTTYEEDQPTTTAEMLMHNVKQPTISLPTTPSKQARKPDDKRLRTSLASEFPSLNTLLSTL